MACLSGKSHDKKHTTQFSYTSNNQVYIWLQGSYLVFWYIPLTKGFNGINCCFLLDRISLPDPGRAGIVEAFKFVSVRPYVRTSPNLFSCILHSQYTSDPQYFIQILAKPSAPKTTILSCSANPLQEKRTAFTQEVIRRLLRTRKQQSCAKKQKILSDYMQILKISGYSTQFRKKILKSGIKGYYKILEDDKKKIT